MTKPDLLNLLRQKVAEYGPGGQSRAARELEYSGGAISQVLSGTYGGGSEIILAKVEEVYGGLQVECPVLGPIALGKCAANQRLPFAATNPQRVALYRACKSCQHGGRR